MWKALHSVPNPKTKKGFVIYFEEDKLRTNEKDLLKKSRFSGSANNELQTKPWGLKTHMTRVYR